MIFLQSFSKYPLRASQISFPSPSLVYGSRPAPRSFVPAAIVQQWERILRAPEIVLSSIPEEEIKPKVNQVETAKNYQVEVTKPKQRGAFASYEMSVTKRSQASKKAKLALVSQQEDFQYEKWLDLEEVDANKIQWELADDFKNSTSVLKITVPKKRPGQTREEIILKRQLKRKEKSERKRLAKRRYSSESEVGPDDALSECEQLAKLAQVNDVLRIFKAAGDEVQIDRTTESEKAASDNAVFSDSEQEEENNPSAQGAQALESASESDEKSETESLVLDKSKESGNSQAGSEKTDEATQESGAQQESDSNRLERLKGLPEGQQAKSQDCQRSQDNKATPLASPSPNDTNADRPYAEI